MTIEPRQDWLAWLLKSFGHFGGGGELGKCYQCDGFEPIPPTITITMGAMAHGMGRVLPAAAWCCSSPLMIMLDGLTSPKQVGA